MLKWSAFIWAVASGAFALTAALYLGAAQDLLSPAHGLEPVVQPVNVWAEVASGALAAFSAVVSFLIAVLRLRAPVPDV